MKCVLFGSLHILPGVAVMNRCTVQVRFSSLLFASMKIVQIRPPAPTRRWMIINQLCSFWLTLPPFDLGKWPHRFWLIPFGCRVEESTCFWRLGCQAANVRADLSLWQLSAPFVRRVVLPPVQRCEITALFICSLTSRLALGNVDSVVRPRISRYRIAQRPRWGRFCHKNTCEKWRGKWCNIVWGEKNFFS